MPAIEHSTPPVHDRDTIEPEVARRYAQYLELAGLARLASDASVWEEGTTSSVASIVVGHSNPYT